MGEKRCPAKTIREKKKEFRRSRMGLRGKASNGMMKN